MVSKQEWRPDGNSLLNLPIDPTTAAITSLLAITMPATIKAIQAINNNSTLGVVADLTVATIPEAAVPATIIPPQLVEAIIVVNHSTGVLQSTSLDETPVEASLARNNHYTRLATFGGFLTRLLVPMHQGFYFFLLFVFCLFFVATLVII